MSFVDRFLSSLEQHPERAFVTEVRGTRLVPHRGGHLRDVVDRMRGALRALGTEPGDRVVMIAPNDHRWVACDLAMLADGLTVVPLYARQSPEELAAVVRDADPKLVIVDDDARREALRPLMSLPIATLDELARGESGSDAWMPARTLAPSHVATIIYTSGSSGEPKGVMTTVANAEHMLPVLDAQLRELTGRPGGEDRVFHYLPFCFAGSRMVLWASLYRANGVMLSTDLDDLVREIATARPHYFLNVPVLLERIRAGVERDLAKRPLPVRVLYERAIEAWRRIRAGTAGPGHHALVMAAKRTIFRRVRERIGTDLMGLICGSAPLSEETQAWMQDLVGVPVYQVYGLTETTAIVTIDRVGAVVVGRVGYPIRAVEMRLGDQGELLVRGPNVFAGYFRRDEATRACLDAEGWFHTGDQCEIDARGTLRIVGRVKNLLVPSSGHNVAPEPLEQLIGERVPGLEQCVVVGHGRPYLVAILTGRIERDRADRVLAEINDALPHYRRIRRYVVSDEAFTIENGLLTATQKLRRTAIEARFAREIEELYA